MREHALSIFTEALRAVQPAVFMPTYIHRREDGLLLGNHFFPAERLRHLYVIGAGKASAAMAVEMEKLAGELVSGGVIITKYGHGLPLKTIKCIEAGHPVPDANGIAGGNAIADLLQNAVEGDLVIALISGGASALLADCPPGISLQELQELFHLLLNAGADIAEMNRVRKHLSLLKGGQLARLAQPVTLITFILSDVIGDPLESIASGPTVADPSTFADAWMVLEKYRLISRLPEGIYQWMQKGLAGAIPETPKPGSAVFNKTTNQLVGSNRIALKAAAARAAELGYRARILTHELQGEAREQGAAFAEQLLRYDGPKPACLLMGGETTATIRGSGKGGRNQEFALAALLALQQSGAGENVLPVILSAGTDGSDGPTDATGAVLDRTVFEKTGKIMPAAEIFLENNDAYHFFEQAGGLIITGPTQTNVMDIVIGLVP
jgi:glycerate-2-kinase